jgi:GTP pyrophosphokinase
LELSTPHWNATQYACLTLEGETMQDQNPLLQNKEGTEINLSAWLDQIVELRKGQDSQALRQAAQLAELTGINQATPHGESCFHQGLVMAKFLAELGLDDESIIAGILFAVVHYAQVSLDDVTEQFGSGVSKLIKGTEQMDAIHISHGRLMQSAFLSTSIDNLRKMLLAMVDDVRVVLIKLVERLAVLQHIAILGDRERRRVARETMDIYAPLANRLGIGYLKWQLEDFAFRYLEPERYKDIADSLQMHREEREGFVKDVSAELEKALAYEGITDYELSGRVKHIYSIARKMERKNVSIDEIYDVTALRLLVPTLEDCYRVLSLVHAKWHHIPKEFDDYIQKPKPNGYRSIHTAIIGPGGRNVEIQIRTFEMHEESELGVAAHWMYKEGSKSQKAGYDAKIAWLRNLIEWQKEIAEDKKQEREAYTHIFDDRVYVFTPNGDVLDFPKGSTPLDFAYNIHTDLGHRCRGAKVNDHMVPLNYQLQMGDKVEVLTGKEPHPSRDWLSAARGYLMTPRAKAKVHHWFRVQDYDKDKLAGAELFEKESRRTKEKLHLSQSVLEKLHYHNKEDLFAALGRGEANIHSVITALLMELHGEHFPAAAHGHPEKKRRFKEEPIHFGIEVVGASNLLTYLAGCCQPVPGDSIIGYVTLGHGVSIHRQDCPNVGEDSLLNPDRLIEVHWRAGR